MVRRIFYIILMLLLPVTLLFQQENKIVEKKAELDKLKDEITTLQKELNAKSKKEKESFASVEIYSRQGFLLNKVINQIREEEAEKQKQILACESDIQSLKKEIKTLQDNYAKYVRAVYKYGKVPEWSAVLDSRSLKQAVLRIEYLRRFSARRETDLEKLKNSREKLVSAIQLLESEKKEKTLLANQKQEEEKELTKKLNDKKNILASIRNDKSELRKELNVKKHSEVVIRNMITKLVEEAERKRKEELERLARLEKEKQLVSTSSKNENIKSELPVETPAYDVDLSTSAFSSFAAAKGKLKWPLNGGTVIKKYGENRNKKLNTVTMNYGIDIKAAKDLNVKSVAEGVISAIDWVPGYGSVIIITHKGDYRTVYSHLSEIFVKEGDKVNSGTLIAKTAESTEGHILHFEVWNSRDNQNPEIWLSRR